MKRLRTGIAGLCLVYAIAIAALNTAALQAGADSHRVIPVRAISYDRGINTSEAGDSCGFSPDFSTFPNSESQIIVRDENDRIIAVEDMRGILEDDQIDPGEFNCVADFDVEVSDAAFYSVYVNNVRADTIRADEFPVDAFNNVHVISD